MISKLKRDVAVRFRSKLVFSFCFVSIFLCCIRSWSSFSLNTVESWSCLGLSRVGIFYSTTIHAHQIQLEHLDGAWQVAQPPGRRASWDASAPCSWTASLWTWRVEPRSPRGSDPGARATAAATAPSARTRVRAWSERTASPATAGSRPSLGPFVTEVWRVSLPPRLQTHRRKLIFLSLSCVFHNQKSKVCNDAFFSHRPEQNIQLAQ